MLSLNHILAIVDFRQDKHFALPRAIELAHLFGSRVSVVANIHDSYTELLSLYTNLDVDQIKKDSIKQAKQKLQSFVDQLPTKGLNVEIQVTWNPSLHRGLTEFINQGDFDLVVKTTRKHNLVERILFTPTDWHLLRDTSSNLLFVQTQTFHPRSSILGAININDDAAHKNLNVEIIKSAVELSEKLGCEVNLFNAFPWPAINLQRFNHLFDDQDLFLKVKAEHKKEVARLVDSVADINGKVVIGEGLEPEDGIPEIAKSTQSQILILGTVRRKGVEGMLIGNTAEKILDQINCEVLALK